METHTIYDCLNSDSFSKKSFSATLQTINSRLQYPGRKGLVLVEGDTDLKVMTQFLKYHIHIMGTCGKCNAMKVMENFNHVDFSNLLCILDNDYKKINISDERFFYYDNFDLETTFIKYDSVLNGFTRRLSMSLNHLVQLRDKIMDTLYPLECLRCVNFDLLDIHHKKQFSCDDLIGDFYPYYIKGKKELENYILMSISNLTDKGFSQALIEEIKNLYCEKCTVLSHEDKYLHTNGHDFMKIFIKETGNILSEDKEADQDHSIACCIRDGLTLDIFKSTDLYKALKLYETKYDILIIKG